MSEEAQTYAEEDTMVRVVLVDVYAYREDNDILFTHAWKRQGDPARRKGKIEIPNGEGDVPIHFTLHNRTNPRINLAFENDPAQAMWVDRNDCPVQAGDGGGQITFDGSAPLLLRVTDDNSGGGCILHYALRFTGDDIGSGTTYEYDPEIRNGGGG